VLAMKAWFGSGGVAHSFLTSALNRDEWSASHHRCCTVTASTLCAYSKEG